MLAEVRNISGFLLYLACLSLLCHSAVESFPYSYKGQNKSKNLPYEARLSERLFHCFVLLLWQV